MKRRWAFAGLACAALLALTACSGGGSNGGSANGPAANSSADFVSGGTFSLAYPSEIPSFNPYSLGAAVANFLYDPLINVTSSGKVVSGLADKWQVSATQATFTLRSGVTCSDGAKLTASDVANAINYVTNPKNALPIAAEVLPPVPITVTADNAAGTVTVKASSPFSFLDRSVGEIPIVCPQGIANPKILDHGSDGTGPYKLTSYTTGGPYMLTVRNGYAWGPNGGTTAAKGIPSKIALDVVSSTTTAANELITGQINAGLIAGPDLSRLPTSKFFHVYAPAGLGDTLFNEKSRVTSDIKVRQALVMAMNRPSLANVASSGLGTVAASVLPTNAACHANTTSANLPGYNLAAAKRVLTQDGWVPGTGGIRTKNGKQLKATLVTGSLYGAGIPAAAQLMASTWQSLGVDVSVSVLSATALTNVIETTGNWDIYVTGLADTLPSELVSVFAGPTPPTGTNVSSVNNPQYAALTAKAMTKASTASCPGWAQAEAALLKHFDIVPIADSHIDYVATGTQFQLSGGVLITVVPTSIRMVK